MAFQCNVICPYCKTMLTIPVNGIFRGSAVALIKAYCKRCTKMMVLRVITAIGKSSS